MAIQLRKNESIQLSPSLRQLNGFGQGRVFELTGDRLTLGRSDENQIVLVDESVSRVHAVIETSDDGGLVLFDNQSRNGIMVNGRKVEAHVLQGNEQIQIGNIAFQVFVPDSSAGLSPSSDFSTGISTAPPKSILGNRRIVIYGGLGLILGFLYFASNTPTEDPKKAPESSGEKLAKGKVAVSEPPKIPKDLVMPQSGPLDPLKNPIESELEGMPWNDSGITESEAYFRKGQREYFNKNYQRAISSFELSLSLNQNHPAAAYYLASAVHESEREAAKHFETALKYFESLQFKRAIYHFQQVQSLLAHKQQDPGLVEAEKYIKLSRQRLQAAELFP